MEATVATLVTVFGFDPALAQRAVDSIQDKDDVQLAWNWILDHGGEDQGGPVIPTQICPHVVQEAFISPSFLENIVQQNSCCEGCPSDEYWLYLTCGKTRCGRYAQRHNLSHWIESGHRIALSLRDPPVWCYGCDKYLKSAMLENILTYAQHYKSLLEMELPPTAPPLSPPLHPSEVPLCCVSYDPLTERHRPLSSLPPICQLENPERTKVMIQHLSDCNLLSRCVSLPSTLITMEQLHQTHSPEYISSLQSRAESVLSRQRDLYPNEASFEAALLAAGSAVSVSRQIVSGKARSGFAMTRPPGHHARRGSTGGFCLLNNIAIAVKDIFSQQQQPQIERILIFDWDIHHGDGLQELFYEDDRVLYVSIHSHEHQPGIFYDSNGELTACGSGKGLGYNVNIPLPYRTSSATDAGDGAGGSAEAGYGDKDYDFLLKELVVPISHQFDPQLVIIAAGFDACAGDPVGGNRLLPEWFGKTTALFQSARVSSSHGGRVMLCLEGGYQTSQTSKSVEACLRSLLEPRPVEGEEEGKEDREEEVAIEIKQLVSEVKQTQSAYWSFK